MLKIALDGGGSAKNVTSPYDGTALIAAAHLGHVEAVRMLIAAKAPLNHVNNLGWTALIEAIVLGNGGKRHVACLDALVEAGADVNIADRGGSTPLRWRADATTPRWRKFSRRPAGIRRACAPHFARPILHLVLCDRIVTATKISGHFVLAYMPKRQTPISCIVQLGGGRSCAFCYAELLSPCPQLRSRKSRRRPTCRRRLRQRLPLRIGPVGMSD